MYGSLAGLACPKGPKAPFDIVCLKRPAILDNKAFQPVVVFPCFCLAFGSEMLRKA